ncbi:MBL fold metallo-hydrolase [Sneathiella sp.]|jgi:glyoxylase-like metal-dependent hydrolase (beta-lactamase superfamily II)|uniref:MBL fold metallo-hydrolase n=1 Tax=Sneathiella sp. TaxID=1964365 RepID=UPI0039E62034
MVKKILLALAVVLIAFICLLTWHFWPRQIDVSAYPAPTFAKTTVNIDPQQMGEVRLGYFSTGHNLSPEAFVFSGGDLTKTHKSLYSGMVVKHPKGTFLFEGGIGLDVAEQSEKHFSGFQKLLFSFIPEPTARQHIEKSPVKMDEIDFVLLTHLHWDHTGVISEIPDAQLQVTQDELNWAKEHGTGAAGFFPDQYNRTDLNWKFVTFEPVPYENFERSHDLYGDGSIVLVPLNGHTAGSLGMFVTLRDGTRYFFIGDISWSAKAVEIPAMRPPLGQHLADQYTDALTESVVGLYHLKKRYPDLKIVPTHDATAFQSVEKLSDW